ncbi:hypothetical protein LG197_23075 [Pseudomonas asiatica]|uniref:Uncharacterized protein n=1 Tax=Pseudomonas monteilii TaxID=76759 RepID=A0A7X3F0X5_9PSED|nr:MULTISPECIES: hypothetical protein [Pseudomonas]MVF49422.1 hypothetical protein [Pseudomonas monteilii]WDM87467.1 hypothetical protein LG197_23075 [Pseudomonas asiatica]
MSETNEAIASLRSSIEALHSSSVTLQMMVSSKAEASFVSELASRVAACEAQVAAYVSQVAAQGAPITALGHAVASPGNKADSTATEMLTSRVTGQGDHSGYVTGEKPARQAMEEAFSHAKADLALAKRIGSFECKLPEGVVKVTLAADVPSDEEIKGVSNATIKGASGLKLGPSLEEDVRRLLREELKPGGILHRY